MCTTVQGISGDLTRDHCGTCREAISVPYGEALSDVNILMKELLSREMGGRDSQG